LFRGALAARSNNVRQRIKQTVNALLAKHGHALQRTPFIPCSLVYDTIPGWFSHEDAHGLWSAAALKNGSFLEIGHYFGRSTSILCQRRQYLGGIDRFISYDLSLPTAQAFIEHFQPLQTEPVIIPAELAAIYAAGSTITQTAHHHLAQHGLANEVELIAGDFRQDQHTYDFIFCDAVHNEREIAANLPDCIRLLKSGGIFTAHDVTPELLPLYQRHGLRVVMIIGTVGVFTK
jgi:SAM-dependent methyltransferase